jgi:drug/metabolite transporter (DMT)-like permease
MFYVFSFGFLYVLPFGYSELLAVEWSSFPPKIMWEVAFVVVCTTVIAYLLNSSALKQLNPSTVSIYIYTQPVLAALFAIFRNSDSLDEIKIISASIIFIGVYLVSVRSVRERNKPLT